jgi:hypothetical protein
MTSTLDAPRSVLLGDQRPRLQSVPPCESSEGERVAALAEAAGLDLDDWERWVLDQGLGRDRSGQWSAFEKALIVSRQNGKGAILEALELAALFLDDFGADLILHSAHEFKTASEAFRRVQGRIENHPSFSRRVRQVYLQRGAESIELKNGKRLRFIARTGGSGRGFSADLVILDEAYELGDAAMAALLPTLSARPNPQIWYTSTAGLPTSVQLGHVRERGLRGDDPSLAFFEWSVDPAAYDAADPRDWARANPGLGIRITPEYIAKERAALAPDEFARERLGIGTYPADTAGWAVIPAAAWADLADPESQPASPVAFAVAVDGKTGRRGAIGAAGFRQDGLLHVELADYRPGTSWIVPRLTDMYQRNGGMVVVDAGGYEGSLVLPLEQAGVPVTSPSSRDVAAAFGQFYDAVTDSKSLRHLGQPELDAAVAAAVTRDVGDAGRTWGRRLAAGDISPVVAVTLAAWAASAGTQQFFGGWR